jgi:hypothetical protein
VTWTWFINVNGADLLSLERSPTLSLLVKSQPIPRDLRGTVRFKKDKEEEEEQQQQTHSCDQNITYR